MVWRNGDVRFGGEVERPDESGRGSKGGRRRDLGGPGRGRGWRALRSEGSQGKGPQGTVGRVAESMLAGPDPQTVGSAPFHVERRAGRPPGGSGTLKQRVAAAELEKRVWLRSPTALRGSPTESRSGPDPRDQIGARAPELSTPEPQGRPGRRGERIQRSAIGWNTARVACFRSVLAVVAVGPCSTDDQPKGDLSTVHPQARRSDGRGRRKSPRRCGSRGGNDPVAPRE